MTSLGHTEQSSRFYRHGDFSQFIWLFLYSENWIGGANHEHIRVLVSNRKYMKK